MAVDFWLQRQDSNLHNTAYEAVETPFLNSAVTSASILHREQRPYKADTLSHYPVFWAGQLEPKVQHTGVAPEPTCALSGTACCICRISPASLKRNHYMEVVCIPAYAIIVPRFFFPCISSFQISPRFLATMYRNLPLYLA